ncbi:MAG: Rpn family recombination-promoting nuclease/putative transposase, partial [Planctomycetaceae bacterium]|nr:Rpn family recombination-promoting nuclease/putative transposase [Planctomycetaceae bacterium]
MDNQILETEDQQSHNPHDRFARATVGDPLYAGDFLRHYAPPAVAKCVDLDHLEVAPTHFLSQRL